MKILSKFLILFFFILVIRIDVSAQNDKKELLKINHKGNFLYLSKNGDSFYIGNDYGIAKKKFLLTIKDFPELYEFAKENFWSNLVWAQLVVDCYNDYNSATTKPKADAAYFKSFRLNTLKEMKEGPTAEILSVKEPISLVINAYTFDLQKTDLNGNVISNSHGESFKAYFAYGNSGYYKPGFMWKNLKRSLGNDKEALKYIRRYRTITVCRKSAVVLCAGLCVTSIPLLLGERTGLGLLCAATGVLGIYFLPYGKNKYKRKNMVKAIETYNEHLDKSSK